MLPERRKNLIIIIVGVIVFVLLIISIFAISNYVKRTHEDNNKDIDDRTSSPYPNDYLYYGVTLDLENVYRIYGINSNYIEKYIGIRSFYKIQDSIIKDNHLFIYSDGVNDLRYDASNKEFYLYRYDDYYSNNVSVKLAKDYLVVSDNDGNISKREYAATSEQIILSNIDLSTALIKDNNIYYINNKSIYYYNLISDQNMMLVDYSNVEDLESNIRLIDVNDNYLVYYFNDKLLIYSFDNRIANSMDALGVPEDINYLTLLNRGFYYQVASDDGMYLIKEYNFDQKQVMERDYLTRFLINKMYKVTNNIYYIEVIDNDSIDPLLFSINDMDVVKELDNKYLYMYSFGG